MFPAVSDSVLCSSGLQLLLYVGEADFELLMSPPISQVLVNRNGLSLPGRNPLSCFNSLQVKKK